MQLSVFVYHKIPHNGSFRTCEVLQCGGQCMRTSKGSDPWWQHWEEDKTRPVNKSKPNLNGSQAQQYGIIPGVIPPSWPPTMRPEKRVAHLGGEGGRVSGEVRWPDQSLTRSPCQRIHRFTTTVQSRLVLFHHPPIF